MRDLLTQQDIARGKREEERNHAMNYMNSDHKASNEKSRAGYDAIVWHDYKDPEHCQCAECREKREDTNGKV